jgi:uncharacterized protein YjiS (DUF1127 family)
MTNGTTFGAGLARAVQQAARRHRISRSRQQLARLNDHMLRDLGITRSEVERLSDRLGL